MKVDLPTIKGFTFRLNYNPKYRFSGDEIKESMRTLKECTGINVITIAFEAKQAEAHSDKIDYHSKYTPSDRELEELIEYAKELGLWVILKPMVNCLDGTWRAFINFFDLEVPCEPKWSNWFASYTEYILHYGEIAEKTGCKMLIIGCELVMTERKEKYWRDLIGKIRNTYHGLLTYNTDKYQEGEVIWWDALDVISSSGYYPEDAWTENLERIRMVTEKYKKPFFFAECGCPSRTGSSRIPNDWTLEGELDYEEQSRYYETMFRHCHKEFWIRGLVCWDWASDYMDEQIENDGYSVYKKPACDVIRKYYENR